MLTLARFALLAGCVFGAAAQSMSAAAPEPASLLTREEVAAAIGQAVTAVTPVPAEKDPDTGGTLAYCTFRTASSEMIVAVVEFSSATEAGTKMTKEFAAQLQSGETPNVVAENELGERAFWVTSEVGVQYVVLKGTRVLAIGLGGKPPKPLISYRDALRTLARSALAKL